VSRWFAATATVFCAAPVLRADWRKFLFSFSGTSCASAVCMTVLIAAPSQNERRAYQVRSQETTKHGTTATTDAWYFFTVVVLQNYSDEP
jgi:hypothetical protein